MATSELVRPRTIDGPAVEHSSISASEYSVTRILSILASLRLTVVLFALSIVLIFLGTLAQKDQDVWRVVNDTYFRVWIAHVDFRVFGRLAQLFYKDVYWNLPGWFPFFGGKML